ncbi:MAG: GxxExxY protein [Prevotella sp.]|nr:GxxExxY protein [Candidatus Equicola faecalis]MDO4820230.1 GxxExxY protein [Prevotella sp.]
MQENDISKIILDLCIKIHKTLGPGLLEKVYEECLCYEISKAGLDYERQKPIPIVYDGMEMDEAFRADIVVADKVIIELKSVSKVDDVFFSQLLTYLKLSDKKLGLLINFNTKRMIDGFHRVVNGL